MGLVYKLVARTSDSGEWVSVAKKSSHKSNPGGRKSAFRKLQSGQASEELVVIGPSAKAHSDSRELMVALVTNGEAVGPTAPEAIVQTARDHNASASAELPPEAFSLQPGEPVIPTTFVAD